MTARYGLPAWTGPESPQSPVRLDDPAFIRRQLTWRLERAQQLLAEARGETFGSYAQLAGALEAQLDLVCESAEAVLAGLPS